MNRTVNGDSGDDRCDLDPSKICDNCCRCIDGDGEKKFNSVMADFGVFMREVRPDDEKQYEDDMYALRPEDMPDVDPALLAEWEEKLRAEGLGMPAHGRPVYGRRDKEAKKRK